MSKQRYHLEQSVVTTTTKRQIKSEIVPYLIDAKFYTEAEMVETILDHAEVGTKFLCMCNGFDTKSLSDISPSYIFELCCDDYVVNDNVDIQKLSEDFYKIKELITKKKE